MKVYNTLTRTKEELVPQVDGEFKIYACGPTVYNFIHIGNSRPIIIFDVLRRYLEFMGNKVTFVQNFTDIDDKLINKANEEGATYSEIAEKYIDEYWIDANGLGVKKATHHPKATDNIDMIISIISELIKKGYAYESSGDVYFRTLKFKEYGGLSKVPLEDLQAGARIEEGNIKENPMDFVLWKGVKLGEPYWESPFGDGRPGWHIECSAMAKHYLGETIDIHCGGQDLVFPHHENEIAQSQCANGVPFANYWMHNGFINVDNRKMAKSLGNFFTTRDVAEKYGYEPIRYMMLAAHYRSPINYSLDVINQSIASLERLYTARDNMDFVYDSLSDGDLSDEVSEISRLRTQQFIEAMDNDLNTADAVAVIFELVREMNTAVNSGISKKDCEQLTKTFDTLSSVLGLVYNRKKEVLDSDIDDLINKRQQARKDKDFALADKIRDQLKDMGITLEDTREGVKWKRD